MINNKADYLAYLMQDSIANYRSSIKERIHGDECWKFIVCLRRKEYYSTKHGIEKYLFMPLMLFNNFRLHSLAVKCGYSIPANICGKGLALPHRGTIVINGNARIGENCRIHQGVTIGSTSGSVEAAKIGNNVFIGAGAVIVGDITIADDVSIGANAVVTKSITEKGTTWAGIPAKKVSDKDSHQNLAPKLFEE